MPLPLGVIIFLTISRPAYSSLAAAKNASAFRVHAIWRAPAHAKFARLQSRAAARSVTGRVPRTQPMTDLSTGPRCRYH
ncbi:unnamed protein product, partial [Staurois parvus]